HCYFVHHGAPTQSHSIGRELIDDGHVLSEVVVGLGTCPRLMHFYRCNDLADRAVCTDDDEFFADLSKLLSSSSATNRKVTNFASFSSFRGTAGSKLSARRFLAASRCARASARETCGQAPNPRSFCLPANR